MTLLLHLLDYVSVLYFSLTATLKVDLLAPLYKD